MTAILDIRAPTDQTEGTRSRVLRWLKAIGDIVTVHEPLIELETDKVTVEVAAPASGVLREIFKAEQEEIAPGDVLGRLEMVDDPQRADARDDGADARPTQPSAARAELATSSEAADTREPAGARVPENVQQLESARPGAPTDASTLVEALRTTPEAPRTTPYPSLSPAVRRLITERDLEPPPIRGTGE